MYRAQVGNVCNESVAHAARAQVVGIVAVFLVGLLHPGCIHGSILLVDHAREPASNCGPGNCGVKVQELFVRACMSVRRQ